MAHIGFHGHGGLAPAPLSTHALLVHRLHDVLSFQESGTFAGDCIGSIYVPYYFGPGSNGSFLKFRGADIDTK